MTDSTTDELLPSEDREFLANCGCDTLVQRDGEYVVIIFRRQAFVKYLPQVADLMIRIPAGYPATRIDMFWTLPHLKLSGGGEPDRANCYEDILGQKWQRWSRHWPDGAWRPAVDNVRSFFRSVQREIEKGT